MDAFSTFSLSAEMVLVSIARITVVGGAGGLGAAQPRKVTRYILRASPKPFSTGPFGLRKEFTNQNSSRWYLKSATRLSSSKVISTVRDLDVAEDREALPEARPASQVMGFHHVTTTPLLD